MTKNILTHGLHKTCWLLLLTVLLFLVTLSAPYWVPHDPYLQNLDLALQAPNAEYPFGTDRYGRCVFSRVLVGGQSSSAGFSGDHFYYRYCCRALERLLWREAG